MRQLLSLLFLGLLISGCSQQLEDFVRTGPLRPSDEGSAANANPIGIKLSPGANKASGNYLTGRFAITPTSRTLEGQQIRARVSLNQSRPSN